MDRCALKDALLYAVALAPFKVVNLKDNAQTFNKEDAAQDGQHEFFVNDDGRHGNDASDGERASVAHEHLCGISVIPQEADEGTNEGAHKHHQLFRLWYVHNIQIAGIFDMTAHIGQYADGHTYDGRVASTHAVHAVVQVGAV